jgi:hypothetical protein
MADDSADLVIGGHSRRVAMDITKMEPKVGAGGSKPPGKQTEIEGEVHDQEDLNGIDAILKIDGSGEFRIHFHTPTRFRGEFLAPWTAETFR